MRRLFLGGLVAAVVLGGVAGACLAQSVGTTARHYQLIPRLSTLHQSGGFAGVDLDYRLLGGYDLVRGGGPTASATAKFANAEIWGSLVANGPTPAYVIDVDQILNLEGLQGKQLPVASLFDVYQFQGHAGDGSSVNLFASVVGPWMYLRGSTHAPPGSADYFQYQLNALARSGPFADANGDGVVDGADYTLLRKSSAASGSELTGGTSIADWRQQFGETLPDLNAMDAAINAASGSGVSVSSVPEPACWGLVIVGSALIGTLRRPRRR